MLSTKRLVLPGFPVICPYCKATNTESTPFCGSCGEFLAGIGPGSVLASRYEIVKPLGKGGMGMVYEAQDRKLDERVALKVLRPDASGSADLARRFRSEIKLARKVRHENVCAIHDYGDDGPLQFISMELVGGRDLKSLIRNRRAFPTGEAFEAAIQIAEGLRAVHKQGIIHRDLKPSNIMCDSEGMVRLMDFGIARRLGSEGTSLTGTGQVVGTPEYMSPEQARGTKLDFRSDVYALGIVLFEVFTGRVPFQGDTPLATILMHLNDPPPLDGPEADKIPRSMVDVLRRMLAKDRGHRYANMGEVLEALQEARAASPSDEPILGETPTSTMPRPRAASAEVTRVTPKPFPQPIPVTPQARTVRTPTPTPVRRTAVEPPTRWPGQPRGRLAWLVGASLAAALLAGAFLVGYYTLQTGEPGPTTAPMRPPALVSNPPANQHSIEEPTEVAEPTAKVALQGPEARDTGLPPTTSRPEPPPTTQPPRTASPEPTQPASTELSDDPPADEASESTQHPAEEAAAATPAPPSTVEATPPAVAETGFLTVAVTPWATVSVDGKEVGTTPLETLELAAGTHEVGMAHPSYHALYREVTIRSGETTALQVDLAWEGFRK